MTEKVIHIERVPLPPELQRQITRNLRRGRGWPRWASRCYGAWLNCRFGVWARWTVIKADLVAELNRWFERD